ncbi:NF-kappa-B inhibitor-interacting Ras-like protein 1 isoform X2 [Limulus polyphemus]|uniref:NF-kappa-B inhibitor-interacting Ras-like protein 1 isoform X2 n=1 Tax=Limulus polyphemus TaxID=6850 RepID=A0ABM1SUL1_LIMPO|nr:NF-kappa-B inhibitor-interacting Ras-like protein 1 isoform X2 [Limulus polyphemus]
MLRSVPSGKTNKVIVCGFQGCGKTAILEQLIYGNWNLEKNIHPTIEDVYSAIVDNDRGGKEKIYFYDTAGMGFVLVYAINNAESFSILDQIKKDIDKNKDKKDVSMIVLGNKLDLQRDRQVTLDTVKNWALKEKVKHYEVSAAERRTLLEPFIYLASKMNPPPGKSGFPQLGRKGKAGNITMEL